MLFHFVLFPIFLLAIVNLGAFFSYLLSRVMKLQIGIADDLSIQGIIGLFFLGMLGLIFNFFLSLSSPLFLSTIGACIVSGGIILLKERPRFPVADIFALAVISAILAPLAGSMRSGSDGGLYHLPHQLWLRNESIVFGLANLNGRFGFSSLYEYMSSPLWVKEQFTTLSYLQLSFVVYFLLFLIKQVTISRTTHLTLLLGIAVNMAVYTGYMGTAMAYTYTDLPAGLIFATAFIYGHWFLFREHAIQRGEWTIFSILLLSAVFYKASTILLFFWMIFVIFYRILFKKDSFAECMFGLTVPIVFLLIFLIKNFITTGCLLYPEAASCLDVPWAATKNAINEANWITAWARHPNTRLYSLHSYSWFLEWWIPNYQIFLTKLLIAGLFVAILFGGIAIKTRLRSIKILDIRLWAAVVFVLSAFLFWFWKAPNPRFGIGVFVLLFPVLFLFIHGNVLEETKKSRYFLQVTAVIAVMIFACRIGVPWERISLKNALTFTALRVENPEVVKDATWGVRPKKGQQCWIVPECAPFDRNPKSTLYGQDAFYSR